ncbi:MAG: NADH-quinone oxidoreductase subunit K [Bdellovibrionota bacterium]
MTLLLSLLVAALVSAGVYCILQPNLMRIIIGILILSNAANLILFIAAGLSERILPIIPQGQEFLDYQAADPVPQALILTAIVIGFGVIAYFLVLCREFYRDQGEDNLHPRSFE